MKKKLLITLATIVCVVALVAGTIAGTVAYLSVKASVTNTFTYGKVTITMDERRVDKQGNPASDNPADRNTGNDYMLMPGTTYTKDPIIHIGAESQAMYLFLKVDNGIAGLAMTESDQAEINAKRAEEGKSAVITIHDQLIANGWKVYSDEDYIYQSTATKNDDAVAIKSTSTVYYLSEGANEGDTAAKVIGPRVENVEGQEVRTAVDVPTIAYVTLGLDNVTEGTMTAYVNNDANIVITAYAVQGVGDAINTLDAAASVFMSEFEASRTAKNSGQ